MARFPYLPFAVDEWCSGVSHLDYYDQGLYLNLLLLMWKSPDCRIPNDPDWISRRLRIPASEFTARAQPLIREFCQSDGNFITQSDLLKQFRFVGKRSKSASDSAKSRWNKEKDVCVRNANAMPTQCDGNASTLTLTLTKESKKVSTPPAADSASLICEAASKYAYENGVIRLNSRDFNRWVDAFPNLNLRAELESLANWQELKPENWFHAVAAALAKRQREAANQAIAAKAEGEARVSKPRAHRNPFWV